AIVGNLRLRVKFAQPKPPFIDSSHTQSRHSPRSPFRPLPIDLGPPGASPTSSSSRATYEHHGQPCTKHFFIEPLPREFLLYPPRSIVADQVPAIPCRQEYHQ